MLELVLARVISVLLLGSVDEIIIEGKGTTTSIFSNECISDLFKICVMYNPDPIHELNQEVAFALF